MTLKPSDIAETTDIVTLTKMWDKNRDRWGGFVDATIADIERYGCWEHDRNGNCVVPRYLSGSDYSGSLVERSNHRAFREMFAAGESAWWADVFGGHGTFAIVIDCGAIPEDMEEGVRDFFSGLASYPLADESLHSEMEVEAQNEAWASWARREFVRGLEKKFECELDDADGGKVFELFNTTSDRIGEYWENQQGSDAYIDVDRIVDAIDALDTADLLPGIVTGVRS